MANTISNQPTANRIMAAYRPVLFHFKVDLAINVPGLGATSTNPASFCDIYIDGIFYRSLVKTQPASTTATTATYEFDIQDALQEYLGKYLAPNGGADIYAATPISALVFCRFRRTYLDANGFQQSDGGVPVQATSSTPAIPGTGLQSNTIQAVNSTLQHDDNQVLSTHLNAHKSGTWHASAFPLTHRPHGVKAKKTGSDFFPVLINDDALLPVCLKINYTKKDGTTGNATECLSGGGAGCVGPIIMLSFLHDAVVGQPYIKTITITGTNSPFVITASSKPAWMTIAIVGDQLQMTGTPDVGDVGSTFVEVTIENDCGTLASSWGLNVIPEAECVPVDWGQTPAIPNAIEDQFYYQTILLTGSQPFSVSGITAPAWMSIGIIGGDMLLFSGTPADSAAPTLVEVTVTNCDDETVEFSQNVEVLDPEVNNMRVLNEMILNDMVITAITPVFYFETGGGMPINGPLGFLAADHGAYNGIIQVWITGGGTGTLEIKVNGITHDSVAVSGPGTYSFATYNYLSTDVLSIVLSD